MKSFIKIIAMITIVCAIPAASFALVDVGVYTGYGMGDYQNTSGKYDVSGGQYGFMAHLTGGIPLLLSYGVGGYWQQGTLTVKFSNKDSDIDKTAYGIDAFFMLELPIVIHPYVRGGVAIKDKLEDSNGNTTSKYFNSYYTGLGIAFTVIPTIRVFGEYVMTRSKFTPTDISGNTNTLKIVENTFNIGAKFGI